MPAKAGNTALLCTVTCDLWAEEEKIPQNERQKKLSAVYKFTEGQRPLLLE